MEIKASFFKINGDDIKYGTYKNVSAQSIISFQLDGNNYSTKVFVNELGWIVLDIGYENFLKLVTLHK